MADGLALRWAEGGLVGLWPPPPGSFFMPFLFWKGFPYAAMSVVVPVSFNLDYAASWTFSEIHFCMRPLDSSVSIA